MIRALAASRPSGRSCASLTAIALAVLVVGASPSQARSQRVSQIPNGFVNSCPTCHTGFGGPRNLFGQQIEAGFLSEPGPTGVVLWGPTLADLNADGDGASNGAELNDPAGLWTIGDLNPGDRESVTQPGIPDVPRVPFLSPIGVTALAGALLALGAAGIRSRREPRSERAA